MTDISTFNHEADERVAAKHAVSIAEENWRSLCTQYASTFVAAERRSSDVQSALKELLQEIHCNTKPSVKRVGRALDPNYSEGEDDDEEDEEGEGEEQDEPTQPASALLADLAEKHRLRRRTLMQHSSLLELLELPSLMDACVRSSLYEDALSIAGFANTLERRHLMESSSSSEKKEVEQQTVVVGVVSEIRRREADLRRMLIHRLRGDVTMPQCLEVVTALRRLNGVELERRNNKSGEQHDLEGVHAAMEMRLQVDFLEARDAWLEGGIAKVGSAQAAAAAASDKGGGSSRTSAQAEQILDGIERYRTRCFEIVTQFLAIFRGSFAPSTSSSNNQDHSFSLLSMWTARRVQTFLTSLNSNMISHVHDTATLRDALDASSFFASSMGRVGADFQSLLAPIFEPLLTKMIVGYWSDGLNGMSETLKACRDAGIAGPLFGTETSSSKESSDGINVDDVDVQSSRTPHPPRSLLALPPLARFLNAYLTGLNELRRCLLPGAFPSIRLAHSKLIADAKMALQANERAALTPGLRGEATKLREAAAKMKAEFDKCVEPYMQISLEVALGSFDYAIAEADKARVEAEKKAAILAAEKARVEAEERAKAEAEELAARLKAEAETAAAEAAIAQMKVEEEEHSIEESEITDVQSD
mmetsp:Transcript_27635/g.41607  ORF Transcript_27635/g.41607 Transcript_27635/m.41607 type:complete len:647 (-) Transcript_27635:1398-3338(-)|eukprot:scaffold8991_cov155-Skeletonema_dohrnii-CCMP3373.AAC.6